MNSMFFLELPRYTQIIILTLRGKEIILSQVILTLAIKRES